MGERKLVRYSLLSIFGVAILYIVPFIIAQYFFDIDMLNVKTGIFSNTGFLLASKNTLIFMTIFVPTVVILGFVLAYTTEHLKLSSIVSLVIIFPIAVPVLSVSGFFREIIYNVLVNYINGILIVGIAYLWGSIGFTYLVFLISFKNRNKSIEEAAYLDGANIFVTLFKIIIPLHTEAMLLSIILSIYNALRIFKFTYAMFGEFPDFDIYMMQNFLHVKLKSMTLDTLIVSADLFLMFILVVLILLYVLSKYFKGKLYR